MTQPISWAKSRQSAREAGSYANTWEVCELVVFLCSTRPMIPWRWFDHAVSKAHRRQVELLGDTSYTESPAVRIHEGSASAMHSAGIGKSHAQTASDEACPFNGNLAAYQKWCKQKRKHPQANEGKSPQSQQEQFLFLWAKRQRRAYQEQLLTPDQISQLSNVEGWVRDKWESAWEGTTTCWLLGSETPQMARHLQDFPKSRARTRWGCGCITK